MKPHSHRRAFTLIELLIYVAILGLIGVTLGRFAVAITTTRGETYKVAEIDANVRAALGMLEQKVREASSVVTPSNASTSNDTLVLTMPSPTPQITFSVAGGTLFMTEFGGFPVAVTSSQVSVRSPVTFTNLAAAGERSNIRILMTIELRGGGGVPGGGYSQSIQTAISTRP